MSYPADPATVFMMLIDPEFQALKCEASYAIEHDETITEHGDDIQVVVHRALETKGMPGLVKSIIGESLKIRETYLWSPSGPDGARPGDLKVAVGGAPVRLNARCLLSGGEQSSTMLVTGEIKVDMFMGGQIEKLAAPWILKGLDVEERLGREWLARQ